MRDPTPRIDMNLGGGVVEGVGLGETFDLREQEHRPRLGLQDIWTLHAGAEWGALSWLRLRGGFQYRPSPVPRQEGSTNLLDNQVYGFSAGVAWIIGDQGKNAEAVVEVELGGLFMLLPRRTLKKAEADPVGALSHGGFVAGGALSISHKY